MLPTKDTVPEVSVGPNEPWARREGNCVVRAHRDILEPSVEWLFDAATRKSLTPTALWDPETQWYKRSDRATPLGATMPSGWTTGGGTPVDRCYGLGLGYGGWCGFRRSLVVRCCCFCRCCGFESSWHEGVDPEVNRDENDSRNHEQHNTTDACDVCRVSCIRT